MPAIPPRVGPARAPDRAAARQWRVAISVLTVVVVATFALFSGTVWSMVETWWIARTYGHGFLILPVALYLVWRQRFALATLVPRVQPLGLVPLALAVLAWLVAAAADIRLIQQIAFVGMIQSLILTLLGWKVTRQILFPLLFLFFMVPFGSFLIPHLQQLTARLTIELLRFTGIPVFLDDLFIYIPSGHFVVAEACSGIRFLISTIVLGTLLAYVLFTSWWRRAAILVLSVAIPIVANGFRAYGIVILAHLSDFRIAVSADHIIYGWIFFSIVTLSLIAAAYALREGGEVGGARQGGGATLGGTDRREAPRLIVVGVIAMAIVVSGPAYATVMEHRASTAAVAELEPWRVEPPWVRQGAAASAWQPQFQGADAELMQAYAAGGHVVDLYIAAYAYQRPGAEIVNQMNRFGDDQWWRASGGQATVTIGADDLRTRVVRLASADRKLLIWYWYWVDGRFTGDVRMAKLLQAKVKLLDGAPSAAVIAIATDYQENPAEAARVLRAFLENVESARAPLDAFAGDSARPAASPANRS